MAPSYAADTPEGVAQEGYDAKAERYLEWALSKPSIRSEQVQKLLALLPDASAASVLELGCGAGVPVTKTLAAECGTVVANDISAAQIALAREHLAGTTNVEFVERAMTELEFEEGKFDAVVALYSVIHLSPEGQKLVFGKMRRWMKAGGLVLVNMAVEASSGRAVEGWLGMMASYWSSFGQEGNEKLLVENGFEVVECEFSEDVGDAKFGWFIAKAV